MHEARPCLPAVLPADGVAVLGVLWEGNVDSDQRRAVLQSHTASDHSHAAESRGGRAHKTTNDRTQRVDPCTEKEQGEKHDR